MLKTPVPMIVMAVATTMVVSETRGLRKFDGTRNPVTLTKQDTDNLRGTSSNNKDMWQKQRRMEIASSET